LRGSTQPVATYVVDDIVGKMRHFMNFKLYKILNYSEEIV